MIPIDFMKKTWEKYKYLPVRVVAFPVPPVPVDGVIFMPDSFSSKSFDGQYDVDLATNDSKRILFAKSTHLGPAILVRMQLGDLLDYDDNGLLDVKIGTFCAGVSFYIGFNNHKFKYAEDVVVNSLRFTSRSCHPGSHYVIPKAPYLTALVQYCQAPDSKEVTDPRGLDGFIYTTPEQSELIFPNVDFDKNILADKYIANCVVSKEVSCYNVMSGLGDWSHEYLRQLRLNRLVMEKKSYEQYFRAPCLLDHASKENGRKLGSCSDSIGVSGTIQSECHIDQHETSTCNQ